MDAARRGEDALNAGKNQEALEHFTTALKASPTSPNYYLKRSVAYHRLQQYDAALADAEYAVVAAARRGRKELIGEANLRRAITLLQLERVSDARLCLSWAGKAGANKNQCSIWTAKIKQKLKDIPEGDERTKIDNIQEIPKIELPDASSISTVFAGTDKTQVASTSSSANKAPAFTGASNTTTSASPAVSAPSGSSTLAKNIRHEWYQNNDNVYLNLFAKNVPKDKAVVDIQPNFINISFPLDSGSTYDFSLDPVFSQIKHLDASFRILPTKVEITLPKAIPGIKWENLEGDGTLPAIAPGQTQATTKPAASASLASPYSSKGGQVKDWDKITQSLQTTKKTVGEAMGKGKEKLKPDDTENADLKITEEDEIEGDPADHFFKSIFKNADPDTRRAMMKSYQESGGTALSTNWSEVSKGTVAVSPPDGMEAKKWQS